METRCFCCRGGSPLPDAHHFDAQRPESDRFASLPRATGVMGSSVSSGKNQEKDYALPPKIFSLAFFYDHEGDVICLRQALSEFVNGFQNLPLEREASRGSLLLNDFQ